MGEHTKEPWHTGGNGTIIYDVDGWGIASTVVFHGRRQPQTAEQNARRIVACVNSCAGIQTEALEDKKLQHARIAVDIFRAKLMKQRDELLSALKHHQEQTRPIQATIDLIARLESE